nr:transmembrane protein 202-like isoform X1 [Equus asinus]
MAVEKSSEPEARMKRRDGHAMTFEGVYNASILDYPTHRPVLPYRVHRFYSMASHQRQLLTQSYVRLFCAGLVGFTFVLLLCLTPFHWVQFTVLKDKKKLLAGLWTLCHSDLCWSHRPEAPYYLQYSRTFFLISALSILIIITWLSISLTKRPGDKTYVDLGISIFCFISGTCLLLCLILFLMQVKLYSANVLEPRFLLVYRLNWWGCIIYLLVGLLSGLNHISSRVSSPDQNLLVIPITRTRIRNIATVELGLSETNVGISPWMNQAQERQSNSVPRSRTQTEAGTQTELETQTGPETQKVLGARSEPEAQAESRTRKEPEIGYESVTREGLITQARLATEIEPADTVKLRPETEKTIGNETSDMSSSRREGNEKKMTKDRDDEDRNLTEKNDDDKTKN